jgi:hypothetical protein
MGERKEKRLWKIQRRSRSRRGKMPRRNERMVWHPNLHRTLRVDVGGSHEGRGDCKPGVGTPNLVRAWLP